RTGWTANASGKYGSPCYVGYRRPRGLSVTNTGFRRRVRRDRRTRQFLVQGRPARASSLQDYRDDHRPAEQLAVDPRADDAADHLLELVRGVVRVGLHGLLEGAGDLELDLVEHRIVLRHAAGVDVRAGHDGAGLAVDHRDDGDEPLLAEHLAVLEVGI